MQCPGQQGGCSRKSGLPSWVCSMWGCLSGLPKHFPNTLIIVIYMAKVWGRELGKGISRFVLRALIRGRWWGGGRVQHWSCTLNCGVRTGLEDAEPPSHARDVLMASLRPWCIMCSCGNSPGTRSTARHPAPVPCAAPEPRSAAPGLPGVPPPPRPVPPPAGLNPAVVSGAVVSPTHSTGTAHTSPAAAEERHEATWHTRVFTR